MAKRLTSPTDLSPFSKRSPHVYISPHPLDKAVIAHKDRLLRVLPPPHKLGLTDDCPLESADPRIFSPDLNLTAHQNDLGDLAKLIQIRDFIIALSGRPTPSDGSDLGPIALDDLQYNLNLMEGSYLVNKRGTVVHEAQQLPSFRECCRAAGRYPPGVRRMRHRIITSTPHLHYVFNELFRREFCIERFRNWWGASRTPNPHHTAIIELIGCTTLQAESGINYIILNFERSYNSDSPEASLMTHFRSEIEKLFQRIRSVAAELDVDIEQYIRTQVLKIAF